jgi:hypothetical protein
MAVDSYAAEDCCHLCPGTSASTFSTSTPAAAGVHLIGFHCLVCGCVLRSKEGQPVPALMCAGSNATTGSQHELARTRPLLLH